MLKIAAGLNGESMNAPYLWEMQPFNWSIEFQVLFFVTAGLLMVQLFYFFFFFLRLNFHKERRSSVHAEQPVSIIIAARNERRNLEKHLPKILNQNYPEFQVVVVNDRSWDGTFEFLEDLRQVEPRLHVVHIPENELHDGGKKLAVTCGVKGAKYDLLLFTDADCLPNSENWINEMVNGYDENEIVLGYSPYQKRKGVLNWLIRFDTVQVGLHYLSFALSGVPYMGVGRNMSYKKETFWKAGGFKSHYHIKSGDDDLFINQVAKKKSVRIVLHENSFMESIPKESFSTWFWQKRRHLTTSKYYKWWHKLLLGLYPLTYLLFTIAAVSMLFFAPTFYWALGMLLGRILIQMLIFARIYTRLGAKDLLVLTPILEFVMSLLMPMAHFINARSKPLRWS
jgi:glycosyltransferase involved in cell wall biosynthesis